MSGQILHLVSNEYITYQNKTTNIIKTKFIDNCITIDGSQDLVIMNYIIIDNNHFNMNNIKYLSIEFSGFYLTKIPFQLFIEHSNLQYKNNKIYIDIRNNKFLPSFFNMVSLYFPINIKLIGEIIHDCYLVKQAVFLDTNERRSARGNDIYIPILNCMNHNDYSYKNIHSLYFDLDEECSIMEIMLNDYTIVLNQTDLDNKSIKYDGYKCFYLLLSDITDYNIDNIKIKINNTNKFKGNVYKIIESDICVNGGCYSTH